MLCSIGVLSLQVMLSSHDYTKDERGEESVDRICSNVLKLPLSNIHPSLLSIFESIYFFYTTNVADIGKAFVSALHDDVDLTFMTRQSSRIDVLSSGEESKILDMIQSIDISQMYPL